MSNQIQIKVAELNQLNPLMIADDSRVEQKFIQDAPTAIFFPAARRPAIRTTMATTSMNCVLTFPSPVMGNWLCASVPDRSGM